MYPRTRNTYDELPAATDHSLAAIVAAGSIIALAPLALTYLAGHPVLGGGFLVAVGLTHLPPRSEVRGADANRPSSHGDSAEVPVWFGGPGGG